MKKVIFLIMIIIVPFKVFALSASSSIVMDLDTGRILHENNIHEKKLIASITKIMTAIITIENCDLNKEVVVDKDVLKAYGSAIYIEVGEKLTIKDLLMGLLLRSGNDAAIVIAKNVAGSMDGFVNLMNELASNIGMKDTHFINNHGLEDNAGNGNISTAYDMALLTKYAMSNNTFKKIFSTKSYKVKTNYKTYNWISKNKLIHKYDFINGGKTGFTIKARRTLVTTASNNNINLVIVTLNDPNDFSDHISLYENVFKNYKAIKVLAKDLIIKNDDIYKNDKLYIENDIYIPIKKDEEKDLRIDYELYKNSYYSDNDCVGIAKIYLKDTLLKEVKIYVYKNKNTNNKISLWQRLKRWLRW